MRNHLLPLVLLLVSTDAFPADFHVSLTGNDQNPGTEMAPFATLQRSRDRIREMKQATGLPEDGVTVWIHGGTYPVSESIQLGAEDSGTAERRIAYRAVPGEEVHFTGGRPIPSDAFKPITDPALLQRIDPGAEGKVLTVDLKGLGISDLGIFPDQFESAPLLPELFYNEERMTLARWPNDSWAEVAKVIEAGPAPWRNYASDQLGTFEYDGDRPARWLKAPAVWLHGYWCFDWSSETIKVKSIDPETQRITLAKPHVYGIGSGNAAARRYYAVNILEELDQPGEYFLDRESGALYFWPPEPVNQGQAVLSILTTPVFSLNDVSYITLRGLGIEDCAGTGIEMKGGSANEIAACRVTNTGQAGMVVTGGDHHRIVACDIHDTGTAGVRINGGDRKTLSPSGHEVVNNHIWRVSRRQRTHAHHLEIGGVGIHVAHNLLHDAPHQAIMVSGNDHLFELNEIHHIAMETDDCGAFYMGRNPSERGTVIRHNYWHDIGSTLTHGSCAVYFDDGAGGQTVDGNVFFRACGGSFGAVFLHGGHDNTVTNNVFIECKRAIRQVPWSDSMWKEWLEGPLWKSRLLEEVDITKPPYIDRYPDLAGYLDSASHPRINHASRNVAVQCGPFIDGNWEESNNLITETDPGFVDAAAMNFQLREDSRVFREIPGFEGIPVEQIGLVQDELRPKLGSGE
jgi:hypothetical protein